MHFRKYVVRMRHFGAGSLAVILVTFVLFVLALFTKGFTHDLLLETAIFLVSVKLIIMTYRNSVGVEAIQHRLDLILTEERHLEAMLAALQTARQEADQPPVGPDSGG